MMPASNRGAGMNMGFPDPCNTIVGPATVPIPYPNIAMNAQAMPFSPTTRWSMMPALTMASKPVMSSGMEAGTAHPLLKGPGGYTMGNPIVSVNFVPAINLLCPTNGNNMNNPLGAVAVPSVTNVFLTREAADGDLSELAESLEPGQSLTADLDADGQLELHVRSFTIDLPTAVFRELTSAMDRFAVTKIVFDLRGCRGGDLNACLRLLDDFLPRGAVLAEIEDADGDVVVHRSKRDAAYDLPVVVAVDGRTASAAELFAACLQFHGRAVVTGESTYGKSTVHQVQPSDDGAVYPIVGRILGPGASWPVVPDRRGGTEAV